ncbi:MAG TPA: hypothetical protein VMU40_01450 [Steroidobacteraceae bacterium]|nr:hypothetical protein [Steroidobacteraceae bacterium]
MVSEDDSDRRRRVRRTTIILATIALAFYIGFIVMSVVRASRTEQHSGAPHGAQPQR